MKKNKSLPISPQEQAALNFLNSDFNQCFEQMRYYDNQIVSIFKFMFVAYTFLTGVVTSLYQYFVTKEMNLQLPAILTLSVALLLGIFIFAIILRNRVYFVRVARYLNEQRALFLEFHPLGFENNTHMYTRSDQPLYFNWWSSQSWLIYIVACLNSMVLLVIGLFLATHFWKIYAGIAFFFLIIQITLAVFILKARE